MPLATSFSVCLVASLVLASSPAHARLQLVLSQVPQDGQQAGSREQDSGNTHWVVWTHAGSESQAQSSQLDGQDDTVFKGLGASSLEDQVAHAAEVHKASQSAAQTINELLFGNVNQEAQYDPGQLMAASIHQQQMLKELDALDAAEAADADYPGAEAATTRSTASVWSNTADHDVDVLDPQLDNVEDFRYDGARFETDTDEQYDDLTTGSATQAMGDAVDAAYSDGEYDDRMEHMLWVAGASHAAAAPAPASSNDAAVTTYASSGQAASEPDMLITHHHYYQEANGDTYAYHETIPCSSSLLMHPLQLLGSLLDELLLRSSAALVMQQAGLTRYTRLWYDLPADHATASDEGEYAQYHTEEEYYTPAAFEPHNTFILSDIDLDAATPDMLDDWGSHPLLQPSNYQYLTLSSQPSQQQGAGMAEGDDQVVVVHRNRSLADVDVGLLLLVCLLCATALMAAGFVRNFVSLRRVMGGFLGARREVLVPMVVEHEGRQYIVLLDEAEFAAAASAGAWSAGKGDAFGKGAAAHGKGATTEAVKCSCGGGKDQGKGASEENDLPDV